MSDKSPYYANLESNSEAIKAKLDALLEKHRGQPVGNGYIDLIFDLEAAQAFALDAARLGVAILEISWWCFWTDESKNNGLCPHGAGGPINKYGDGYYSECFQFPAFSTAAQGIDLDNPTKPPAVLATAAAIAANNYMAVAFPKEEYYSPCLKPALWLAVPDNWQS